MIDRYDWPGGTEAMLRFGPATGPVVVLALPPFEEANRTRTLMVSVLRQLAEAGIGGALPDLPGQGESLIATEEATLTDWRAAFAACVATLPRPRFSLSIRAGALVDGAADVQARWSLSPQTGAELSRELHRTAQAAGAPDGAGASRGAQPGSADSRVPAQAGIRGQAEDRLAEQRNPRLLPAQEHDMEPGTTRPGGAIEIAGNRIAIGLLDALADADIGTPDRIVRLESDARAADRRLPFSPPWRRAEPDANAALAQALADDIAEWVRTWRAA
ncbi:hypothetical protein [Sphingomonas desiccabilis]|uniref:Uncharacterized protein n=1 Tax=Sphingomonas desiccabilis TaxID=429134 RepID=A0A4Q2IZH5_9SPHN|nr:hypothetical protein [Sphingomonas desiccabilis]MBB3910237.1 hypothetical protein [Sphingomonas desiccabilis]RXZ34908.1 hypothetical protein EO081_04435 [Sphingomonas desiccabilis]